VRLNTTKIRMNNFLLISKTPALQQYCDMQYIRQSIYPPASYLSLHHHFNNQVYLLAHPVLRLELSLHVVGQVHAFPFNLRLHKYSSGYHKDLIPKDIHQLIHH